MLTRLFSSGAQLLCILCGFVTWWTVTCPFACLNSGSPCICIFMRVSLLIQETINTSSNIFIALTVAAQIISAAGDTLSVPAPALQHEESIKTGHPQIGEGKPKPATSGSLNIYICGFINDMLIRTI